MEAYRLSNTWSSSLEALEQSRKPRDSGLLDLHLFLRYTPSCSPLVDGKTRLLHDTCCENAQGDGP